MDRVVVDREQSGYLLLVCCCPVGGTNSVLAGEPVRSRLERRQDRNQAGTINIILVTNATLTVPALIGAVQVATESKTATLIKHKVPSAYERAALATGTGTDAVVLASSLAGHHKLRYSGTHTEMGAMIGRLVGRCVERGLRRFARWSKAR
jgi:adenosylcobinamide amidohydrolase